jgi:biotin carboxyl carrier protein
VRFEVETGRRRRTIEVRRSGDGWAVTMDGRVRWVDFAPTGDRWSMLVQPVDSDASSHATESMRRRGASYDIAIERQGQGKHIVHVDGHAVPLTVLTHGKRSGVGSAPTNATGPVAIVTPMPGRVVKVLVKKGDAVLARQGLVVVEAMKMENELRAPRAGTVAEVRVREGAPVEANVVLVVIT